MNNSFLQQQVTQLEAQLAEATTCLAMASLHGPPKPVEPPPSDDPLKSKLDEELAKRDELIERLHQENERLFERLTAAEAESQAKQEEGDWLSEAKEEVPKTGRPSYRPSSIELRRIIEGSDTKPEEPGNGIGSGNGIDRQAPVASSSGRPLTPSASAKNLAAPKSTIKTTPAGEYLCVQLDTFDVEAFGTDQERADGVNKLLMLVLAAVIKAGSAREHEMLAGESYQILHKPNVSFVIRCFSNYSRHSYLATDREIVFAPREKEYTTQLRPSSQH